MKYLFGLIVSYLVVGSIYNIIRGDGGRAGEIIVSSIGMMVILGVIYIFIFIFNYLFLGKNDKKNEIISQEEKKSEKSENIRKYDFGVSEERSYEIAADEFDSHNIRRGLYIKLLAEADGDEKIAKARYIKKRSSEILAGNSLSNEDENKNKMKELALVQAKAQAKARELELEQDLEQAKAKAKAKAQERELEQEQKQKQAKEMEQEVMKARQMEMEVEQNYKKSPLQIIKELKNDLRDI